MINRFFFGKNKVMIKAIGTKEEDEYQLGLHQLAPLLSGNVGIFCTNSSLQQVQEYVESFIKQDYARGGMMATRTGILIH